MIYYTSDLHFGHENIIKNCNRPYNNIEDMDNALIKNWNRTVNDTDTVYVLGDIAIAKNQEAVRKTIDKVKRLKGHKILIQGNHDHKLIKNEEFKSLFGGISIYGKVVDKGRNVILMHYPIESWEQMRYNSIHLHGHMHKIPINNIKNRYNVGVDINNYRPVTLDELIAKRERANIEEMTRKSVRKIYDSLTDKEKIELAKACGYASTRGLRRYLDYNTNGIANQNICKNVLKIAHQDKEYICMTREEALVIYKKLNAEGKDILAKKCGYTGTRGLRKYLTYNRKGRLDRRLNSIFTETNRLFIESK